MYILQKQSNWSQNTDIQTWSDKINSSQEKRIQGKNKKKKELIA